MGTTRGICIDDNVWLGKNSAVDAGTVVKGEFPENCITEGNPAKTTKFKYYKIN